MHKIFIVDDDANFLFGASRILEKASFEAISANEGWLGVLNALNEQPDLIILDVNMPGMNGFEESILIRENPQNAIEILKRIPSLRFSLDIPYFYRERLDGKGFIRGVTRRGNSFGCPYFQPGRCL